jgi:hypothetical protein
MLLQMQFAENKEVNKQLDYHRLKGISLLFTRIKQICPNNEKWGYSLN